MNIVNVLKDSKGKLINYLIVDVLKCNCDGQLCILFQNTPQSQINKYTNFFSTASNYHVAPSSFHVK